MAQDLMKLQSGSDIIGVTLEGVSGMAVDLTEEVAGRICGAFSYWLGFKVVKNPFDLRICVGNDGRLSAEELKSGLLKGITMFGAEAYDAGLASTPAMFMSTALPQMDFDGAIMITAGNQPWNMNGFKFFSREGGLNEEDVTDILKLAQKYVFVGEYYEDRPANAQQMCSAYLRQRLSLGLRSVPGGLRGMHIVVDAGNGAGGFFAKEVLEPMGADISGSLYLEPDGKYPNHQPDPEDPAVIAAVGKAVADNKADLGLIFDADVDRVAVIGPDGSKLPTDACSALEESLAAEGCPGGAFLAVQIVINAAQLKQQGKDITSLTE